LRLKNRSPYRISSRGFFAPAGKELAVAFNLLQAELAVRGLSLLEVVIEEKD
jgi:hypothetical protein